MKSLYIISENAGSSTEKLWAMQMQWHTQLRSTQSTQPTAKTATAGLKV